MYYCSSCELCSIYPYIDTTFYAKGTCQHNVIQYYTDFCACSILVFTL